MSRSERVTLEGPSTFQRPNEASENLMPDLAGIFQRNCRNWGEIVPNYDNWAAMLRNWVNYCFCMYNSADLMAKFVPIARAGALILPLRHRFHRLCQGRSMERLAALR